MSWKSRSTKVYGTIRTTNHDPRVKFKVITTLDFAIRHLNVNQTLLVLP
jgi:hypothetical protein